MALEFVGGSITSNNFGETDLNAGGGMVIHGNDADPHTDPGIIDALRGINPWVDAADFDHHGFGLVKATPKSFDVTLKRVSTIKQKTTALLHRQGLPLPRGPRPAIDQGRERPEGLERRAAGPRRARRTTPRGAAIAIARSWIARPVESNSVTAPASGAPGRRAGQHRAEVGHPLARDRARLDGAGQLAAVRRLRPLVAEQRAALDRADRRLGLAGTVRAEHVQVQPGMQVGARRRPARGPA